MQETNAKNKNIMQKTQKIYKKRIWIQIEKKIFMES